MCFVASGSAALSFHFVFSVFPALKLTMGVLMSSVKAFSSIKPFT